MTSFAAGKHSSGAAGFIATRAASAETAAFPGTPGGSASGTTSRSSLLAMNGQIPTTAAASKPAAAMPRVVHRVDRTATAAIGDAN